MPLPPPNSALDEYSFVEGVSGSAFDDEIFGSDAVDLSTTSEGGARGSVLTAEGIALISGLQAVVGAGVTSFSTGNILLGGDGSDVIEGRGGNDIIDGDKWLNVRIGVHAGIGVDGGIGAEIDSANSLTELVTEIFNGTYNPGQLRIHREILTANGAGDIDIAVFSDVRANYDITSNANGTITVEHLVPDGAGGFTPGGIDGIDTLRNIERLQFSDVQIAAPAAPTDIQWNAVTPSNSALPGTGTIANLSSVDADNATPYVYSLVSVTSPNFTVSAAGVVARTGGTMAANQTYTLVVRSTDSTGAFRDETFVIRTGTTGIDTITAANANDTIIYGGTWQRHVERQHRQRHPVRPGWAAGHAQWRRR